MIEPWNLTETQRRQFREAHATQRAGGETPGTDDKILRLTPREAVQLEEALDSGDDELEIVPEHHNDLGDWCPHSGKRTADGTCPLYCRHADEIVDFDAGERDDG
jgi:hypothetical protein